MTHEGTKRGTPSDIPVIRKADVRAAFDEWVEQHGYIWFEGDLRLAGVLAAYLKVSLEIDGLAVAPDDIPGVTQG